MPAVLRTTLALLVCLAPGCRPEAPAPTPGAAPAPAADSYAGLDLPALDVAWTAADYLRVRDALVKLERERPELLPRLDGAGGPLLRKWTDFDAFTAASKGAGSIAVMLDLGDAAAHVYKLYAGRMAQGGDFGDEYVATIGITILATTLQLPALLEAVGLDAAGLKAQPVRLEGIEQVRYGLALMFTGLLTEAAEAPERIDPAQCAATLARVAAEVSAYLLPEERAAARERLAALAARGARPDDVAILKAALADDRPRAPVVADLLAEHREFTRARQELLTRAVDALIAPVVVGSEGDWTRWAFPEAGFSAAFPQPPNAQNTSSAATDGVPVTLRTLGIKTATGTSFAITCITRPSPGPGKSSVDDTIAGMKLTGVREVTVDGVAGKEGTGSTPTSRALVRAVPVGHGVCLVIAEYPARFAADVEADARRFVDSFKLGPFRG